MFTWLASSPQTFGRICTEFHLLLIACVDQSDVITRPLIVAVVIVTASGRLDYTPTLWRRLPCLHFKTRIPWFALMLHTLYISHTRTVVRECFKGDEASQWKRPKFDPSPHQNPLTDLPKNWHAWLRHGRHTTCKILYRSVQGFLFPRYVILPCFWGDYSFLFVFWGSSIRLQPTPLNRFLRKVRRNTSFRVRKCFLGVSITIFDI